MYGAGRSLQFGMVLAALFPPMIVSAVPRRSFAGERELAEFRASYPAALARLKRAYSNVEITGIFANNPERPRSSQDRRPGARLRLAINGEMKKLVYTVVKKDSSNPNKLIQSDYVLVFGDDDLFDLRRDETTDSQYVINLFEKTSKDRPAQSFSRKWSEFYLRGGRYAWCMYANENFDFNNIFGNKFELVDGSFEFDRNVRVFRLKFANTADYATDLAGEAEFLPDRSWAVRRIELKMSSPVKAAHLPKSARMASQITSLVEYGGDHDGVPVPVRITTDRGQGKPTVFSIEEVKFDAETPRREFTLGYFGLPDMSPPPPDPQTNHASRWLIGIGLAALIAAILLVRRNRRD